MPEKPYEHARRLRGLFKEYTVRILMRFSNGKYFKYSGRGDGGAGGALAPPLFAKMKFAHLYFTVLR